MKFQEHDLGFVNVGKTIEVKLGYSAIVRIMDRHNYSKYKQGNTHEFIGGYIREKIYTAIVPSSEHWYVVVDLGGYGGDLISNARVLTDYK